MYPINNILPNTLEYDNSLNTQDNKIPITELFSIDNSINASSDMQQLQQGIEQNGSSLENIIIFLKLSQLVKPEYSHLFIIKNENNHLNVIISGYIKFTVCNNTFNLDTTKIIDVNSIILYVVNLRYKDSSEYVVNLRYKDSSEYLETKLIFLFKLVEQYIKDGKYMPDHDPNDAFNITVSQGYLLAIAINFQLDNLCRYLLNSKYLAGDVNANLKNKPKVLAKFNFIDSNLLVTAIFTSSADIVNKLIKSGAKITSEVLRKTIQAQPLDGSNVLRNIVWKHAVLLVANISDDCYQNIPNKDLVSYFFVNKNYALLNHIYFNCELSVLEKKVAMERIIKIIKNMDDDILLPYAVDIITLLYTLDKICRDYDVGINVVGNNTRYSYLYFQFIQKQLIEQKSLPKFGIIALLCLQDIIKNKDYFSDSIDNCSLVVAYYILMQIHSAIPTTEFPDIAIEGRKLYSRYLELPKIKKLFANNDMKDNFGDIYTRKFKMRVLCFKIYYE